MAIAYILQNQVSHTRFLPSASKHSFVYPTLSILVPLNALEDKKLDLLGGWLFGYGSTWGRVTGLRPSGYLFSDPTDKRSIRSKLVDVLDQHGYSGCELCDTWLMTMPSYLGVEGINPLSVYFCYRRECVNLWLIILEVHNTFGERHVYVLETNSNSEQLPSSRFDHQWTFPRQFHVSPFNDRSGHYMCQVIAPPHPPSIIKASLYPHPRPVVKLTLLTPTPHPQKKLVAVTRTTHSTPLSSTALLLALAHAPLILLQTLPRILYQAFLLHYHKFLDVYQRPEPCVSDPTIESHLPTVPNSIQPAKSYVGRGVGWQPMGPFERWCQRRIYSYLQTQCTKTHVSVTFIPANPFEKRITIKSPAADLVSNSDSDGSRTLEIYYRSPRLFTLLFTMPSPMHAIMLGMHAGAVFSVSSEQLFTTVFTAQAPTSIVQQSQSHHPLGRLAQYIRSLSIPAPHSSNLSIPPYHVLDEPSILITLSVLLTLSLLTLLERIAFNAVGARFVLGDEPWGGWARLCSKPKLGAWGRLGSVRRTRGT